MEKTLLNLIPGACSPEVHLSQYDKGRAIPFKLAEGKSAYSVPDGSEIVVEATKPSGLGFVVPVTFDGDTATMTITETMSNEYGRFPAELSITKNGNKIGTANFVMNIERSPHPEGTTDGDAETIIPELTLLVERIEAAAEDVDEKSELFLNLSAEAETLEAGSPATASYSDGVLTLGIPRGYDGDDTKADAIVKSASGEVASFSDGGNGLLVKSLIANITPKQSGSGDPSPSNVRPISGYSEVKTTRCGKNLIDDQTAVIYSRYIQVVGTNEAYWREADDSATMVLPCKPNAVYTLSINAGSPIFARMCWADFDPTTITSGTSPRVYGAISVQPYTNITITTGATAKYLIMQTGKSLLTTRQAKVQIELGSTVTAYEPYNGTTYTTSLGQTVYGGTLDVVSGELTITKVLRNLGTDQSGSWYMASTSVSGKQRLAVRIYEIKIPNAVVICNVFKTVSGNDIYNGVEGIGTDANERLLFYKSDLQTVADWKSWATTNNLTVCYELATPTEITLTPTEVKSLLGANNIWANSGTVEVEYRADTTLAYNELLSLIASLS